MTSKTLDNRQSKLDNMNRLNSVDGSKENPQGDVKQNNNHYNNPNQKSNTSKKVFVIGDSMVKHLRSDKLYSSDRSIAIMKHTDFSSDDMVNYMKPVARKISSILLILVGRNDLTKNVNTMNKVWKCVEVIRELDNTENIQIGFCSIIQWPNKDSSNEIKETNIKLTNYCLGKGFIFVDIDNINESCLNNSKRHLNKRRIHQLASIFPHF